MKHQNKVRRWLSVTVISGLSLLFFVPFAQAASPIISNFTSTPGIFYFNIKGSTPLYTIDYDFNTGGAATAPVTEQIRDESDKIVYEFGSIGPDNKTTGHYTIQWDGKYKNGGTKDGTYVPDGKYKVYLNSQTAIPPAANYTSGLFEAKSASAPVVELTNQPITYFYLVSGGNFSVNYKITHGIGSNQTIVHLKIKTSSMPEVVVDSSLSTADGNSSVSWDGKINNVAAAAGDYTWTLTPFGSVGYTYEGDSLTGTVSVLSQAAPNPTVTNITATPATVDIEKEGVTFSYKLNESLGNSTVFGEVFLTSAPSSILRKWTYINQASGQNTIVWDGKDANDTKLVDGDYTFKVSGNDGNFQIVPAQVGFTVKKTPPPPPSPHCAGFTDVKTGDPNCKAVEFMQNMGAMTGYSNGTFGPNDLLHRDQIAKIILETFMKFDKTKDYCLGTPSFPDVTEKEWSFQYICRGKALNIITGYLAGVDMGFYRPSRNVNRAEFLALLLRNLTDTMPTLDSTSYDDVTSGAWFAGYAKYAKDNALFTENSLHPTNFTTRMEVAQVMYKLHLLGKL